MIHESYELKLLTQRSTKHLFFPLFCFKDCILLDRVQGKNIAQIFSYLFESYKVGFFLNMIFSGIFSVTFPTLSDAILDYVRAPIIGVKINLRKQTA